MSLLTSLLAPGNGTYRPDSDPLWLGASDFESTSGAPARSNTNSVINWLLDAASVEIIGASLVLPSSWTTYTAKLYWTNGGAGSGDVQWLLQEKGIADAAALSGVTYTETITAAAPTAGTLKVTTLATSKAVPAAGTLIKLLLTRNATAAADTLANDAAMLGIRFEKAS